MLNFFKPDYFDLKWVDIYPLANLQHMKYMCQTRLKPPEMFLSSTTLILILKLFRVRRVEVHACILSYCFAPCFDLEICPIIFLIKWINSVAALATKMVQFSNTIFCSLFHLDTTESHTPGKIKLNMFSWVIGLTSKFLQQKKKICIQGDLLHTGYYPVVFFCRLPVESVYYSAVLDGYHHTESFHDFLEAFEQTQKVIPLLRTLRNLLHVFQSTSTFTT